MRTKVPVQPASDRIALIDEFGGLQQKLRGHKALEKRYEQLRGRILMPYIDYPAEDAVYEDGQIFALHIGAKATQRSIVDMEKLFERLGKEVFFGLVKIPMEELDKLFLQRDLTGIVATGRTGPRTVSAVQRFTEAATL